MSLFGKDKEKETTVTDEAPITEETVTPTEEEANTPEPLVQTENIDLDEDEAEDAESEESESPAGEEDLPDLHGMNQKELLTHVRDNVSESNPFKLQIANLLNEVVEKM